MTEPINIGKDNINSSPFFKIMVISVAFYYNKAKAENLNRFGIADYEDISTLKEKEQQNDGYITNNLE